MTIVRKIGFATVSLALFGNPSLASQRMTVDIVESTVPTLKKVAQYVDTEVIDNGIIMGCAYYGGVYGHMLNIKMLEWSSGKKIYPDQRYDDDILMVAGTWAGYKTGQFIVKVRHIVTDPVFSVGSQLTLSFLSAGKKLIENGAVSLANSMTTKMSTAEKKLKDYANKK